MSQFDCILQIFCQSCVSFIIFKEDVAAELYLCKHSTQKSKIIYTEQAYAKKEQSQEAKLIPRLLPLASSCLFVATQAVGEVLMGRKHNPVSLMACGQYGEYDWHAQQFLQPAHCALLPRMHAAPPLASWQLPACS